MQDDLADLFEDMTEINDIMGTSVAMMMILIIMITLYPLSQH